jgi:hypothetical protein
MAAMLAALFNRVEIPLHSRAVCHNRWEIGPAKDAAEPPTREPELPLPAPAAKPADIYEAGGVVCMTQPLSRPESLPGQTYKIKWPDGDHAMYITINDVIQDGRRRPFETSPTRRTWSITPGRSRRRRAGRAELRLFALWVR